jgi:non-homologous end joining protein Ku
MSRSSWKGSITLDLISIPVTLGRATKDIKETSLVNLCECHGQPVSRRERCVVSGNLGPHKVKGVIVNDNEYRKLNPNEYAHIENSSKDDRLEILDAQPLSSLPLAFGSNPYWVRAKEDDRAAANGLAALALGLAKSGYGIVTVWKRAAAHSLAVIHVYKGRVLLTPVPFIDNLNRPGDQENSHMKASVSDAMVDSVVELLGEIRNQNGFDYSGYEDGALRLRSEAVDRIMANEKIDGIVEDDAVDNSAVDIMDMLMQSLDKRKSGNEVTS